MKTIFLLSASVMYWAISFATWSLQNKMKPTDFQEDTIPKNMFDTFYCRAIETEACIDSIKWRSYISYQVNRIIDSVGSAAPPGEYNVRIFFLIESNGSITYAKAWDNPGFDFAKLAEQIINRGPAWEPSTRNGKFTRAYKKENILFIVPKKTICNSLVDEKLAL